MMIKKFIALAAGVALTLSMAACGGKSESAAGGEKAKGDTFTVGFDAAFPPFGFKDDSGEYVGFDLELAQEVASRNGWEYKAQPIAWDAKDMELDSGTIDCIWNGFTITGRESDYAWSKPYINNKIVFVVTAESGIKNVADLAGKNVEVQADSSGLAAMEDPANAELVKSLAGYTTVPDYNTGLLDLESGGTQAIAMDQTVAQYQIKQRGEEKFTVIDPGFTGEEYGIGFKLGNEALRDQVQKTLDEMIADGTFAKIAKKWGQQDVVIEK